MTIILLNFLIPLINTFFPSQKGHYFSIILCLLLFIFSRAFGKLLKALLFLFAFFSLYALSLIYSLGLLLTMFRMTLLFLPCILMAWLLCSEYNTSEILSALQKLRFPKLFIIGLMVTIRYMSCFRTEFRLIKEAMAVRGVTFSLKHPIRSFEYLLVPQLFRCLNLSNELTIACLTKGISAPAKRTSYFDQSWTLLDFLVGLVFIGGYALIIGGQL
ncbi:energy-coupling factor transporter transmembrane component T family protein [Streptococcus catagoni]|uniref:energy-coupling factor transporter transmembrane component T family protein n=1 Tax=Streptococcus catagoni TaxID=2654874 RepID=UPI0022A78113|nr:energy-coupling factor transporter transmembrane component T [Streptococcus catagoni]